MTALEAHEIWHIWRAERTLVGSPAAGDRVAARWTGPQLVGRKGDKGARGEAAPILHIGLWSGRLRLHAGTTTTINFSRSATGYNHLMIAARDENSHTAAICRYPPPVTSDPNRGGYGMQAGSRQYGVSRALRTDYGAIRVRPHNHEASHIELIGVYGLKLSG